MGAETCRSGWNKKVNTTYCDRVKWMQVLFVFIVLFCFHWSGLFHWFGIGWIVLVELICFSLVFIWQSWGSETFLATVVDIWVFPPELCENSLLLIVSVTRDALSTSQSEDQHIWFNYIITFSNHPQINLIIVDQSSFIEFPLIIKLNIYFKDFL